MAHSKEAHGKHKAMTEFNAGHHEKKISDVECGGTRYSVEMNDAATGKECVDKLSSYVKKHKMKY